MKTTWYFDGEMPWKKKKELTWGEESGTRLWRDREPEDWATPEDRVGELMELLTRAAASPTVRKKRQRVDEYGFERPPATEGQR